MELLHLIQFKTIAECKNMTRAAEKLYISQPALSQMLTKLEKELGYNLFSRNKGKISLNENGRVVLNHTNKIFNQINEMKNDLTALNNNKKTLGLGFNTYPFAHLITTKFINDNPTTHTSMSVLSNKDLVEALLDKRLDLIFTNVVVENDKIAYMLFIKEYLCVSIPNNNPLSKKDVVQMKDLDNQSFVRINSMDMHTELFNKMIKTSNIHINVEYRTDSTLLNMLVDKDCLIFTSSLYKKYSIRHKNRTIVKITDKDAVYDIYLCYLKKNEEKIKPNIDWFKSNYARILKDNEKNIHFPKKQI